MAVIRNVVEVIPEVVTETIRLVMDNGRTTDIKVNLCKIALDDVNQLVYLYDSSQSQLARGEEVFEPNFYILNFNNITNPVEADANDLYNVVLGFLEEIAGGGGDASSANQLIQIDQMEESSGVPSVFKDPSDDLSWFRQIIERLTYSGNGNSVGFYAFNQYQMLVNQLAMFRMQYCQEILIEDTTASGLQTKIQTELTTNHPSYYVVSKVIIVNDAQNLYKCFLTISQIP